MYQVLLRQRPVKVGNCNCALLPLQKRRARSTSGCRAGNTHICFVSLGALCALTHWLLAGKPVSNRAAEVFVEPGETVISFVLRISCASIITHLVHSGFRKSLDARWLSLTVRPAHQRHVCPIHHSPTLINLRTQLDSIIYPPHVHSYHAHRRVPLIVSFRPLVVMASSSNWRTSRLAISAFIRYALSPSLHRT